MMDQVADAAREIKGSVSLYIGDSIDLSSAIEGFAYGTYIFEQYLSSKK